MDPLPWRRTGEGNGSRQSPPSTHLTRDDLRRTDTMDRERDLADENRRLRLR